jgi:hypothetical protein
MRVGHHGHPLGLRRSDAVLEFLSNSRGCRNALAHGPAEFGSIEPAFVFCENSARFHQCNQQYSKPDFA